ncbi:MAG TPA: SagB family peptide dehydrogenase, partial [Blastocatellia bacterium]|nr:SagB family peptide dehydrogenase [Blastocatellia bacterium]
AKGDKLADKHLVAYVVPDPQAIPPLTITDAKAAAASFLPDYMVPSRLTLLDSLPLTQNGKVDRGALLVEGMDSSAGIEAELIDVPDSAGRIAEIIANALKAGHIELNANILELGASSIDIIKMVNSIETEMHFRLKIEDFYRSNSVLDIARSYERQKRQHLSALPTPEQSDDEGAPGQAGNSGVIIDPYEREEFKKQHYGLRQTAAGEECVNLAIDGARGGPLGLLFNRRTHRSFLALPIHLRDFGAFLSCLRQVTLDGESRRFYGSAGALYPVQTYLHVKHQRVENLAEGAYYYDPAGHRLVSISPHSALDERVHLAMINRPVFAECAFSIFLVAELNAITPMYGERAVHFATLEAGLISQLLEMSAPAYGLGLCQIGAVDFEGVRGLLKLGESHILVHSLLGGLVSSRDSKDASKSKVADRSDLEQIEDLLSEVKRLSAEELRAQLDDADTIDTDNR